ncbi:MAG: hypothetical protein KJP16_12405 [Gammaproteobacteria bacterium]|nr:hypothetical protein [Gammaproteobacteria bacterium]NNC56479.1 hypothetical protein [Woeseiaceae bacterium]NNL51605.1 hypothetical protein [Woeseiaceae bacterium]
MALSSAISGGATDNARVPGDAELSQVGRAIDRCPDDRVAHTDDRRNRGPVSAFLDTR